MLPNCPTEPPGIAVEQFVEHIHSYLVDFTDFQAKLGRRLPAYVKYPASQAESFPLPIYTLSHVPSPRQRPNS
jgi:hypothetical protein